MGSYKVIFNESANRELASIDRQFIARILAAVEALTADPFSPGHRKIRGKEAHRALPDTGGAVSGYLHGRSVGTTHNRLPSAHQEREKDVQKTPESQDHTNGRSISRGPTGCIFSFETFGTMLLTGRLFRGRCPPQGIYLVLIASAIRLVSSASSGIF